MFKANLYINETTDIKKTLEKLKQKITNSHLSDAEIESILSHLHVILNNFLARGNDLISKSSHFHSSQILETSKYNIKIIADFVSGDRSFFSRLVNKLRSL
jgi:hypothetical protein